MKLTLLLWVGFFSASAQIPDWLNYHTRKASYADSKYYQGFVSRNYSKEDSQLEVENQLLSSARIRLAESIHISIKSETTSNLSNVNSKSVEAFERKSVTKTDLIASGLESKTYFDRRKRIAYGFVY